MDFTPELLAFQGVLKTVDNVSPYSTIMRKCGNEKEIQMIIERVLKFFRDLDYVNEQGIVKNKEIWMRKFTLYIILNADLPILAEMNEFDGIGTVIWTVPTITKYLMVELCWNLNMEEFVYEIISFGYPQLALEVISSFSDGLKYLDPEKSLHKVKMLAESCYTFICRLHFFNMPNRNFENMLTRGLTYFQSIVSKFSNPPNAGKLSSLNKYERYKYMGNCLYAMAQLILKCLNQFTSKLESEPVQFNELYKLTYKENVFVNRDLDFITCDTPKMPMLECLNKCNTDLLDNFQELVMDVSIEVFCAWSEIEENGKSLQNNIGELCYVLSAKLMSLQNLADHPVTEMLQQLSCKPADISDIIDNTETNMIIENMNSSENKTAWINAIINKTDLCDNLQLMSVLESSLDMLNEDSCYKLYKVLEGYLTVNTDSVNFEYVQSLSIEVFRKCNLINKYEILDNKFTDKGFVDIKGTNFDNMMTEVFNKLINAPDADHEDVLTVFFQNPQEVYMKIFNTAMEGKKQTGIMIKVISLIKKYSNHFYSYDSDPCIIRITQDILQSDNDNETKSDNLIGFLKKLKEEDIIPTTKLLLLIVMPNLHKALVNKDVRRINTQVSLISEGYTSSELLAYRSPMLAMFAQILEVVRWKLNMFTPLSPDTLHKTLLLQNALLETYNSIIPEKEERWLKSKLKNLQPLNMYHYRVLWKPPGGNYIEIVSGTRVHACMDIERLTTWLSQVLGSITQQEWCDVWKSLLAFGDVKSLDILNNAMCLLTAMEASNRSENTWNGLVHCYMNYIHIIRYMYLTDPPASGQIKQVINKISSVSNVIDEDKLREMGTVFLPLTAYIVETKKTHGVDLVEYCQKKSGNTRLLELINNLTNGSS